MFDRIQHINYPNIQKVLPAVYGDELSYYELLAKFEDKINSLITLANELGVDVAWAVDAMKNIADLPEIDAQVQALQETVDSLQTMIEQTQDTLDNLPSYEQFLSLENKVEYTTEALGNRVPFPSFSYSKYGTENQVLSTNGDGTTKWVDPIEPTDEQASTYISQWLSQHPEATTTVLDGSITYAKLANDVKDKFAQILDNSCASLKITEWEQGTFHTNGDKTGAIDFAIRTKMMTPSGLYVCDISEGYRLGVFVYNTTQEMASEWLTAGKYIIQANLGLKLVLRRVSSAESQTVTIEDSVYVDVRCYFKDDTAKSHSLLPKVANGIGVVLPCDVYVEGRYISTSGSARTGTDSTINTTLCKWIEVSNYEYVQCPIMHTSRTTETTQLSLAFYSDRHQDDFISGELIVTDSIDAWVPTITKVPEGAKWMLSCIDVTKPESMAIYGIPKRPLEGMHVSILSDSMSAYAGYIPEGNHPYYTGENAGVTDVNEMWWMHMCNVLGCTPLIIDAWSGSTVAYNARTSMSSYTPMCSDLRTSRLHDGDVYPDIIILSGGTNDYHRNEARFTQLGDIDDTMTGIDRESVLEGTSTFAESYASTIKQLQINYPNAIIVCASLYYCNYTMPFHHNETGKTAHSYNEVIKKVCSYMSVPFIDISKLGFNENNYRTYAQDSEYNPVHMNSMGQAILGNKYIEELPSIVNQYLGVKNSVV